MKRALLAGLAVVMASSMPALSQSRDQWREYRQDHRIERGALRGQLTPREYRNLQRQQRRVDRVQRRAEADGVVTWREQRRIERRQDRASRNIYRKTHNNRGYW